MHVFEFVLAIILITSIASIIRNKQKYKYEKGHRNGRCSFCGMSEGDDMGLGDGGMGDGMTGGPKKTDPEISIKLSRLEKMEERLITLEKIITDKGYNLADEIENL